MKGPLARLASALRRAVPNGAAHDRAPQRILFGEKPGWQEDIRLVLAGGPVEITFGHLDLFDFTRYDLVVPLKLDDYYPLRANREAAAGRALFPEWQTVALCDDKVLFNRCLIENGAGALIPTVHEAVPDRFPFILKRRRDEYGAHSHLVRGRDDLARYEAQIADEAYFMQDYVGGDTEYTTHVLMRDGRVAYFVNVAFGMESEHYVRGIHCAARTTRLDRDPHFLPVFEPVLRAVGFENGTCCLNYKLDAGRPKIFEMNPRFGGTLVNDLPRYLRAYAGAAEPG